MFSKPHPEHPRLLDLLTSKADLPVPWAGNAFRFVSLRRPKPEDILSGMGAYKVGGRWNPAGSFLAVYGSTVASVALEESNATSEYYGLDRMMLQPRLMVAIKLEVSHVLDLTAASVRRSLHLSLADLRDEDWRKLQDKGEESLTQTLGRAAFNARLEALLVPSARIPQGINIVIFPENLQSSSTMALWDDDQLRNLTATKYK